MKLRDYLAAICLLQVMACGQAEAPVPASPAKPQNVRSTDFALLPCADRELPGKCVIVLAGGKRVMFGAPAGVTLGLTPKELRDTEAVMLLSLRGEDVEGLDEVRNAAWRAGHEGSLPVAGPTGTGDFVGILNRAYEVSDALIYVEVEPAGGFDAALLAVLPGDGEQTAIVFDTGDLRIRKFESGTDRAAYAVDYNGHSVVIASCGAELEEAQLTEADQVLSCESVWPQAGPVFIFQDNPAG